MTPEELSSRLPADFPALGLTCRVDKGHAVVEIAADKLIQLVVGIKTAPDYAFHLLMDLTAVDWFEKRPVRFDLVYHFCSIVHNHRLRVKVQVADGERAPSLTHLWPIADWFEREVWDLYGIKFEGHPNLKRLLLYEEFKGHPLRKDYPYDMRQPLLPETWPVKNAQVHSDEAGKIHRP